MEPQLSPAGRFERILVATDGTEFSAGAVRAAIHLARKVDARLYAVSVVVTNPEFETVAPQLAEKAEAESIRDLEAVRAEADKEGLECETLLRYGEEPFREIADLAGEIRADLIVMRRRGKRSLAQMMVGDATRKAIGHAPCSVLVAPRSVEIHEKGILLATDGSRSSDTAAIAAGSLAKRLGAPFSVVSVTKPGHSQARRQEARDAVARIAAFMEKEGIPAEGEVVEGRPETAIVEAAKRRGADLIVVGRKGRTALNRVLIGSVSERVVGLADCAVLVVKG